MSLRSLPCASRTKIRSAREVPVKPAAAAAQVRLLVGGSGQTDGATSPEAGWLSAASRFARSASRFFSIIRAEMMETS